MIRHAKMNPKHCKPTGVHPAAGEDQLQGTYISDNETGLPKIVCLYTCLSVCLSRKFYVNRSQCVRNEGYREPA